MKLRVPEIILGFLLAVAVFAAGMTVPIVNQKDNQTKQAADHQAKGEGVASSTDERLANYTWWLVAFTGVLAASTIGLWIVTWRSGVRQSREMQASIKIAKQAADAAELNARAAIGVELPIIIIGNPKLWKTDNPKGQTGIGWDSEIPPRLSKILELRVGNSGRTPAFPFELSLGYSYGTHIPKEPRYIWTRQFAPWIQSTSTALWLWIAQNS